MRRRSTAVFIMLLAVALNVHIVAYAASGINVILEDATVRTPCYAISGETVGEFLARFEKSPRENDIVDTELDKVLADGDVIRITRREYVTHKEISPIPYNTVYSHSPKLKPGEETVIIEGSNGMCEYKYKRLLVNGEIAEETLLSENVIREAVERKVEIGFRSVPVSKFDFKAEFDENLEPIAYKQVLRGQRSAGYSAKPGAGTASGIAKAGVGYVAVNPHVIPYGSKLFIQSADGKFIYGYAIAADTGTALMDGRIAVDCFYETYEESCNHGIRTVDIFILE